MCMQLPSTLYELQFFSQHVHRLFENPKTRRLALAWCTAFVVAAAIVISISSLPPNTEKLIGVSLTEEVTGPVLKGTMSDALFVSHGMLVIVMLWRALPWNFCLLVVVRRACPSLTKRAPVWSPTTSIFGAVVLVARGVLGLVATICLSYFYSNRERFHDDFYWRAVVIWPYMLLHLCFMIHLNFEHGFFMRMVLFVLGITYMPAAASCIREMHFRETHVNLWGRSAVRLAGSYVSHQPRSPPAGTATARYPS